MLRTSSAALAIFLLASAARAESIRVERSESAGDCPDGEALAAAVRELRKTSTPNDALSAEVAFSPRDDGRYLARIHVRGARDGFRTMTSTEPGCSALASAVAASLALAFDEAEGRASSAAAEPNEPLSQTRPATSTVPARRDSGAHLSTPSAGTDPAPKVPRAAASRSVEDHPPALVPGLLPGHTQVLLGGALEASLPKPGAAFRPAVTFAPHRRLELRVAGTLGPSHKLDSLPDAPDVTLQGTVEVSLRWLDVQACWVPPHGTRLHAALCPAFAYGQLTGTAHGFDQSYTARVPYLGLGAAIHAGGPLLGPIVWDIGFEALARLRPADFTIWWTNSDGEVVDASRAYTLPPLGVLAEVSLGVRLW